MTSSVSRRQFIQATALAGAGLALPKELLAAKKKSVLIFTKSSGFEHQVIKVIDGHPSILEQAVKTLGDQHGFEITATKDGRVFDSPDFRKSILPCFSIRPWISPRLATTGIRPCRRRASRPFWTPSMAGLALSESTPLLTLFIPSLTLKICRTVTLPTARRKIPICGCWAASLSFMAAIPGCRQPISL